MIYVLRVVKELTDNRSHYPIVMQRKILCLSYSLVRNCSTTWRWLQSQAETCLGECD